MGVYIELCDRCGYETKKKVDAKRKKIVFDCVNCGRYEVAYDPCRVGIEIV